MTAYIDTGCPGQERKETEVFGDLEVDFVDHVVRFRAEPVPLSYQERRVVEILARGGRYVVTKEMFLDRLYGGMNEPNVRILDVLICEVNKKLKVASGGMRFIEGVWGRGYLLLDPGSEKSMLSGELNFSECNRPRVRDHTGLPLTIEDLPRLNTRWSMRRKAKVVWAVKGGLITPEEAGECYLISAEELATWQKLTERHGVPALRATKAQWHRRGY